MASRGWRARRRRRPPWRATSGRRSGRGAGPRRRAALGSAQRGSWFSSRVVGSAGRRLERQGATAISSSSGASRPASAGRIASSWASSSAWSSTRTASHPSARAIAAMSIVSKAGHGAGCPVSRGELVHDRVAAVGEDHERARRRGSARRSTAPGSRTATSRRRDREHGRSGSAMRRPIVAGQREAEAAHRGAEEAHRRAGRDAGVQLGPAGGATPRRGWRRPAGARPARRRRGRRAAARRAPAAGERRGRGRPGPRAPRARVRALDRPRQTALGSARMVSGDGLRCASAGSSVTSARSCRG